jgi:hypothetical protein
LAKILTIRQPQCIREIEPGKTYYVEVLAGAAEALVSERQLRNTYETNREIKYWSTFFLLRSMTTANKIQNWRGQKSLLLQWVQMSETTFYRHLVELQNKGLITVGHNYDITLVSKQDAAKILGIGYSGTHSIPYNPITYAGKQVFQYFLRAEEIRHQLERQLYGLLYHLDKNPLLRNDLFLLLERHGANRERLLQDDKYIQERLLKLQMQCFRHGSDILDYIFSRRADINRSVKRIQKHHSYKGLSSVSYMKRRMADLQIISVRKEAVESLKRARIYMPGEGGRIDAYKWVGRKKTTTWFLCDQLELKYEINEEKKMQRKAA